VDGTHRNQRGAGRFRPAFREAAVASRRILSTAVGAELRARHDATNLGQGTNMRKAKHVFHVIIEQDEAGYYVAECPALRACYTQGKTYEEVVENIRDVIALCLEDLKARKKSIPRQAEIIGVRRVEISV
jgi:predicted RNase H-like HicB family nuclease